jgi:tetratricopeptide (TPR) repeat protein
MYRANKFLMDGNNETAYKLYEKAYNHKQSKPSVKITYAYVLLKEGMVEKSEAILRQVMNQKLSRKDEVNATLNLSIVLWKKNELDEAISHLKKLYEEDYKTTILYQSLGYYLILNQSYDEALKFNLEAYEYNNSDTSILDNLALNYYYLGDYQKAEELYKKLVAMNPTFVSPYYFYAQLLVKENNYKEALEMLNRALNCRFTFLSAVTKEEVQNEIEKVENLISSTN